MRRTQLASLMFIVGLLAGGLWMPEVVADERDTDLYPVEHYPVEGPQLDHYPIEQLPDAPHTNQEIVGGSGLPPGLTEDMIDPSALGWYLNKTPVSSVRMLRPGISVIPGAGWVASGWVMRFDGGVPVGVFVLDNAALEPGDVLMSGIAFHDADGYATAYTTNPMMVYSIRKGQGVATMDMQLGGATPPPNPEFCFSWCPDNFCGCCGIGDDGHVECTCEFCDDHDPNTCMFPPPGDLPDGVVGTEGCFIFFQPQNPHDID